MTVIHAVRTAFTSLVAAQLPTVEVVAYPLVAAEQPDELIWVDGSESTFDWRSLGGAPNNRIETVALDVIVRVYREDASQQVAAAAAVDRCEQLLAAVETAVVSDTTPYRISGTVSFARVASWKVKPLSEPPGWSATGTLRLEAKQRP